MPSGLGFRLSRAVLSTIPPPIPRAKAWASAYKPTPGRPLLDMSQGVPGTPPPGILLDALAKTSSSPDSAGYGDVLGEPTLRSAFAHEMRGIYGDKKNANADITSEDVAITAGCNMAFVAAVMCLADAGDEVILPVPWYFNHQMSLNLLGIKAVPLYTRSGDGFLPCPVQCENLISPKTKAIALVTPNNPTGAVYPPALITAFAQLAHKHNIALIIDETYRDFVEPYPPHHLFSPSQSQTGSTWSWRSTLIHLFSFSKSYALPGHRLGLIAASPAFLQHIMTTLDCLQICAPRPPQLALADASLLSQLKTTIQANAKTLRARHEIFRKALPPEWTLGSQGGYYAFVKHPFRGVSSLEFCERLARELGVLVLPVQFFGGDADAGRMLEEDGWDRWVRFSVANVDDEKVVKVCERLEECKRRFGLAVE